MERLCSDLIVVILAYLDKDSKFHFLNIAKFLGPMKKTLYDKYLFDHDKIGNYEIKKHIKHIKCSLFDHHLYEKLESVKMTCQYPNCFVNKLPTTLKTLEIIKNYGGETEYYDFPPNLESLSIRNDHIILKRKLPKTLKSLSLSFSKLDYSLDNLPSNLESLAIICFTFNKPINNLPTSLINLSISSSNFNQSLDKLPENLETLTIKGIGINYNFNQSLDNLPSTLQSLKIEQCYLYMPILKI